MHLNQVTYSNRGCHWCAEVRRRICAKFISPISDVGRKVGNELDITDDDVVISQKMLEKVLVLRWMIKPLRTYQTFNFWIRFKPKQIFTRSNTESRPLLLGLGGSLPVCWWRWWWKSERLQNARSGTCPDWKARVILCSILTHYHRIYPLKLIWKKLPDLT